MSENDATRDDAEHRSLGAALTDLAATMPDDSYPVDDIHAKARQPAQAPAGRTGDSERRRRRRGHRRAGRGAS